MKPSLKALLETSHLYGGNATFIEELYDQYLENPKLVAEPWRDFFDRLQRDGLRDMPHQPVIDSFRRKDGGGRVVVKAVAGEMDARAAEKQAAVLRLINAWRTRGHQVAKIDPLQLSLQRHDPPPRDLDPLFHHLTQQDMATVFNTGSLVGPERMPLREIVAFCQEVYGGTIGAEYMHITRTPEKRWIQARLEGSRAKLDLSAERRIALLERLTAAEGLERYLHSKYVGQKRFSLEGGESLIPLLDELLQRSGSHGIKETALGMAHRGRLNVLVNILGKSPKTLFQEFEGKKEKTGKGSGDVKYHMGFSSDLTTPGGALHLALGFNPSHLEIINPVIEGSVRARQQRRGDHTGKQVLPILIHGDAAFAGQGVVMETLQMSNTRGYATGGTVHIVINNQVGFTTSNPVDSRSTFHCTEVAKMVQAPIFHVNGDDPEAVLFITQLALDYRMEFGKDVVIDLVCYRRHGHNEADEPAATQPTMYQIIRARPTTRQLYAEKLTEAGVLAPGEGDKMVTAYRDALDEGR
ncbi:MAG TPA: thiamine pyrophosphate-dependent enzyme, partial [Gammaproteobacteria bacterium]